MNSNKEYFGNHIQQSKTLEEAVNRVHDLIKAGLAYTSNAGGNTTTSIVNKYGRLCMTPQRGKAVHPKDLKDALSYVMYRFYKEAYPNIEIREVSNSPFWAPLDMLAHTIGGEPQERYFALVNKGGKEDLIEALDYIQGRFWIKDIHGGLPSLGEFSGRDYISVYGKSPKTFIKWVRDFAIHIMSWNRNIPRQAMLCLDVCEKVCMHPKVSKEDVIDLLDGKYGPERNNTLDGVYTRNMSVQKCILLKQVSHVAPLARVLSDMFIEYHDEVGMNLFRAVNGYQPDYIYPDSIMGIFNRRSRISVRRNRLKDVMISRLEYGDANIAWDERAPKERSLISLPKTVLKSGNTAAIIPIGDKLHWSIGKLTDCCQQKDCEAHSVCAHSFCSERSEVIIVRNEEGTILYMSWVWLNDSGDGLMLDSIEGAKELDNSSLIKDWREIVSLLLKENNYIRDVRVGGASWGYTKKVRNKLGSSNSSNCEWAVWPPAVYTDYGDGHCLVGSQEPTESPIPLVTKEVAIADVYKDIIEFSCKEFSALTDGDIHVSDEEVYQLEQYDQLYHAIYAKCTADDFGKFKEFILKYLGENPFNNKTEEIMNILDLASRSDEYKSLERLSHMLGLDDSDHNKDYSCYDSLVDLEDRLR